MKNILVKKLILKNFKGIRSLELDFNFETTISGENGTGKTTIFDAFTWLFFGKDSTDRKDFEIKTLDNNNVVIPKIQHEVSAIILLGYEEVSIRRVLKENWVKKRGSIEAEFSGNVTDYYWNEVPMQQKEFQTKVSQIIDESIFKLLTNPLAFNSLKWQDQRNALVSIAGEISDTDIAQENEAFKELITKISKDKSIEDYKKQIIASIKKAKDDLKAIPTRIDEINSSIQNEKLDFELLEFKLNAELQQLEIIDSQILNSNKAFDFELEKVNVEKIKISEMQSAIQKLENDARKKAEDSVYCNTSDFEKLQKLELSKKEEIESFERNLKTLQTQKDYATEELQKKEGLIIAKRNEWASENGKKLTFNDGDFHCPTCQREFELGDVEKKKSQAIENFQKNKLKKITQIQSEGKSLKEQKESIEKSINELLVRIDKGEILINEAEKELQKLRDQKNAEKLKLEKFKTSKTVEEIQKEFLDENNEYQELILSLEHSKANIQEPKINHEALAEKRKELILKIDGLKSKISLKEQFDFVKKRTNDLLNEEKLLAQLIADVEKEQFLIESFNRKKIETLESRINGKFKIVKFKLFETQINGGEIETCKAIINGVPFSDANTASKINAGLDIINTLCEFYQVTAPIFIDNRESIINLTETAAQTINLRVSKGDKNLKVC